MNYDKFHDRALKIVFVVLAIYIIALIVNNIK